jgi:hypothetical protein
MGTLGLVAAFGMPLAIFLFLGSKLVVRLRLEQRGLVTQARVTSVRDWSDEGIKHQTVSYQFSVGGDYYSSSTNVPMSGKGYVTGDPLSVTYLPWRPDRSQPVSGGAATSTGLTAFVMLAMVALMVWMLWLLNLPHP